jgi:exonuclease III
VRAVRVAVPGVRGAHRRPGADVSRRGPLLPLRILSWNVARRVGALTKQAESVAARKPDAVALQEITARTLPLWRAALAEAGLAHAESSLDSAPATRAPAGPRRTGVLLAARTPIGPTQVKLEVPWPETVLSGMVSGVELTVAHVPNSRNGWIKVETLEGVVGGLAGRDRDAILCGDFNTPRSERRDGTIITFARDQYGRLRPERGERWDAAELGVLTGLWPDAFRSLHGYERKEISWNWPRFQRSGYRLYHIFSTLAPTRCEYVHDVRISKLSDHSAMEADL